MAVALDHLLGSASASSGVVAIHPAVAVAPGRLVVAFGGSRFTFGSPTVDPTIFDSESNPYTPLVGHHGSDGVNIIIAASMKALLAPSDTLSCGAGGQVAMVAAADFTGLTGIEPYAAAYDPAIVTTSEDVREGDLVLACFVAQRSSGGSLTDTPAGWNAVSKTSNPYSAALWTVATSTGPITVTLTPSTAPGVIVALSGSRRLRMIV